MTSQLWRHNCDVIILLWRHHVTGGCFCTAIKGRRPTLSGQSGAVGEAKHPHSPTPALSTLPLLFFLRPGKQSGIRMQSATGKGGGQTLLPCLSTLPLLSLMRKQGGKRGGESTPTIFVCFPCFVGKAILQGAGKLTDYKLLGAYSDSCYSDTCTIPTIQKSAGVDKNCLIQFNSIYLTYT